MTKRKEFEKLFTELTGISMRNVRRDEFGYFWIPPTVNLRQVNQEKLGQLQLLAGVYQRGPIDDVQGIGGIWMRPPCSKPRRGVVNRRHEFLMPNFPGVYVVFEGAERKPFWNRPGDGIRFVYTNWNYRHVMALTRDKELTHTVADCDGAEFYRYRAEAERKHKEISNNSANVPI